LPYCSPSIPGRLCFCPFAHLRSLEDSAVALLLSSDPSEDFIFLPFLLSLDPWKTQLLPFWLSSIPG